MLVACHSHWLAFPWHPQHHCALHGNSCCNTTTTEAIPSPCIVSLGLIGFLSPQLIVFYCQTWTSPCQQRCCNTATTMPAMPLTLHVCWVMPPVVFLFAAVFHFYPWCYCTVHSHHCCHAIASALQHCCHRLWVAIQSVGRWRLDGSWTAIWTTNWELCHTLCLCLNPHPPCCPPHCPPCCPPCHHPHCCPCCHSCHHLHDHLHCHWCPSTSFSLNLRRPTPPVIVSCNQTLKLRELSCSPSSWLELLSVSTWWWRFVKMNDEGLINTSINLITNAYGLRSKIQTHIGWVSLHQNCFKVNSLLTVSLGIF